MKPRISDELEKSKIWKLTEISEPGQLRTLKLPDNSLPVRVCLCCHPISISGVIIISRDFSWPSYSVPAISALSLKSLERLHL